MADAEIVVTISSNDQRFFDAIEYPEGFLPYFAQAAEAVGAAVIEEVRYYPPTTEANQPGRFSKTNHRPMGFYERGRGWWYPVKNPESLGRIRSKILPGQGVFVGRGVKHIKVRSTGVNREMMGPAGYKLQETSQDLGESWVMVTNKTETGVDLTIGNTATYSAFVQGVDQTRQMAAYEWKTIESVLASPFFDEVLKARIGEAFSEYYGTAGFGM